MDRPVSGGHDHVHVQGDQLGGKSVHSFCSALGGPVNVGNIARLEVTEVAHALAEGFEKMGDAGVEQADLRDLARLLRARSERPSRRATDQHDERAAVH